MDRYSMDHVVREVLVQIGQTVRVLRECLILTPQSITCCQLSETKQVNQVQSTDVIATIAKMILPVPRVPESV